MPRRSKKRQDQCGKTVPQQQMVSRVSHVPLPSWKQPDFSFINVNAEPEFVTCIKQAVSLLDLSDRSQFTEEECYLIRYHRMYGWDATVRKLQEFPDEYLVMQENFNSDPGTYFEFIIVTEILNLLPLPMRLELFPYHAFLARPSEDERKIIIFFYSLSRYEYDGSIFYYSEHKPTVKIHGENKIVAFSPHAVQRIVERLFYDDRSLYFHLMNPFWYLSNYNHFEEATIHPFTPGFTFYHRCIGNLSHEYVQYILGGLPPQEEYYFRIGYCPVLLTSEYALAKTVLFPGYKGTPEYSLIVQADIPRQEKSKLLQHCDGLTISKLNETCDFRHMKWFHDNGIQQVKRIESAVYLFQEEAAAF